MAAGTQQACGESGYSVGLNSPTVDVNSDRACMFRNRA